MERVEENLGKEKSRSDGWSTKTPGAMGKAGLAEGWDRYED